MWVNMHTGVKMKGKCSNPFSFQATLRQEGLLGRLRSERGEPMRLELQDEAPTESVSHDSQTGTEMTEADSLQAVQLHDCELNICFVVVLFFCVWYKILNEQVEGPRVWSWTFRVLFVSLRMVNEMVNSNCIILLVCACIYVYAFVRVFVCMCVYACMHMCVQDTQRLWVNIYDLKKIKAHKIQNLDLFLKWLKMWRGKGSVYCHKLKNWMWRVKGSVYCHKLKNC